MQKLLRFLRLVGTSVLGWGGLMSGSLFVGPNIYNVYRVANGEQPISGGMAWAVTQLGAAIAFVIVVATAGYAERKRAMAAEYRASIAEEKLADVGADKRARNKILAGLSDFTNRGNGLRESAPPPSAMMDYEAALNWKLEVARWVEETAAYLTENSKSAAARFDKMSGIAEVMTPRIHHLVHDDFIVLERRLDNLHDIVDRADSYFT